MDQHSEGLTAETARREISQLTQGLPKVSSGNDPAGTGALISRTITTRAAKAALKTIFNLTHPPKTGNTEHDRLLQQAAKSTADSAHQAAEHTVRNANSSLRELNSPANVRTCAQHCNIPPQPSPATATASPTPTDAPTATPTVNPPPPKPPPTPTTTPTATPALNLPPDLPHQPPRHAQRQQPKPTLPH